MRSSTSYTNDGAEGVVQGEAEKLESVVENLWQLARRARLARRLAELARGSRQGAGLQRLQMPKYASESIVWRIKRVICG